MSRLRRLASVLCLTLPLLAVGCSTHAQVTGKVVEDGKPYQDTGESVILTFIHDETKVSLQTGVQPDGTFKVYGSENKGLLPGKYKIGIEGDVEGKPGVKRRVKDISPDASGLEVDLAAGQHLSLTIDIIKRSMESSAGP